MVREFHNEIMSLIRCFGDIWIVEGTKEEKSKGIMLKLFIKYFKMNKWL